jgi:hypothetical protein
MTVRAKFKVADVVKTVGTFYDYTTKDNLEKEVYSVTLYAVADGTDENKEFFASTPAGHIQMNTVNAAAGLYFKAGDEYYLDFTKADSED